jgi:NADPH:quinone reductase-like Zn-dependent oxidoreductase
MEEDHSEHRGSRLTLSQLLIFRRKPMLAVQLTAYGDPTKFLHQVELPEPGEPRPDQVLIQVDFSPVNPNDLMLAQGIYSVHPELPSVIGNEGVGHVIAVGAEVLEVQVGDRVLIPFHVFAWAERVLAPAKSLIKLSARTDIHQLAMLRINPPTAALLLSEYVALKPGDWIVQNAANSGVGRAVIAFARERGIRTANLVRRPELFDELTAAGGDLVLLDTPDAVEIIRDKRANAPIRLALDGVSGPSTALLGAILSTDSTLVSYSAMSGAAMSLSPLDVIFKRITVRGFLLNDFDFVSLVRAAIEHAAELIAAGRLHAPIAAIYPLSAIKEAVAHTLRGGKVLLEVSPRLL